MLPADDGHAATQADDLTQQGGPGQRGPDQIRLFLGDDAVEPSQGVDVIALPAGPNVDLEPLAGHRRQRPAVTPRQGQNLDTCAQAGQHFGHGRYRQRRSPAFQGIYHVEDTHQNAPVPVRARSCASVTGCAGGSGQACPAKRATARAARSAEGSSVKSKLSSNSAAWTGRQTASCS